MTTGKELSDPEILARIREGQRNRYNRWMAKQKEQGAKPITIMLTSETVGHLERLQEHTGLSIAKLVNKALMAFEPGGQTSTRAATPDKGMPKYEGQPDKSKDTSVAQPSVTIDPDLIADIEAGAPDKERQSKVDLVCELRRKGLSFQKIADYMIVKKVGTLSGRGTWQQGAINRLLKNAGIE